jgi:hypothetical protein
VCFFAILPLELASHQAWFCPLNAAPPISRMSQGMNHMSHHPPYGACDNRSSHRSKTFVPFSSSADEKLYDDSSHMTMYSHEVSIVWLTCHLQYWIFAIAFNVTPTAFRRPVWTNPLFCLYTIALGGLCWWLLLMPGIPPLTVSPRAESHPVKRVYIYIS